MRIAFPYLGNDEPVPVIDFWFDDEREIRRANRPTVADDRATIASRSCTERERASSYTDIYRGGQFATQFCGFWLLVRDGAMFLKANRWTSTSWTIAG